ncbi:MAG: tRNA 2-thiouridine(34) synthase MnmA [Nitrospirae bacterium]|nr:tRNA 2-thiouridine(34) synthase MnmA [Nitrospirota bacterium]
MERSSKKVIVGMSGGVDSSVAAALLLEAGYEVHGVTFQVWAQTVPVDPATYRGCCALEAVEDAEAVCGRLGIPYEVIDVREAFRKRVIQPFAEAYLVGVTPNPCVECNRSIKFDFLLAHARAVGADFIATGHYARVAWDDGLGRFVLLRGRDARKDQSYVLYPMTQAQLGRTIFPLGGLTKEEVREEARRLGLPVAEKADSQEICFLPEGRPGQWLEAVTPGRMRPGPLLSPRGEVLGEHRGIGHYTVGQRRGIGLAAGKRQYVVAIEPERNAVIVGEEGDLGTGKIPVGDLNWIAVERLGDALEVEVKYRSMMPPVSAGLIPEGMDRARVIFAEPQRGIAPGQAAVFYWGERVLGGGTILRS